MTQAAEADFSFSVRPLREDERAFPAATWIRDYLSSPTMRRVPQHRYFVGQARIVTSVLERARVFVAEADNAPLLLGWIAVERDDDGPVVHYAYTKHDYRKQGVGRALLLEAMQALGVKLHVRRVLNVERRDGRNGVATAVHYECSLDCGHRLLTGKALKGTAICGRCSGAQVRYSHSKAPAMHWANSLGWSYDPFPAYE